MAELRIGSVNVKQIIAALSYYVETFTDYKDKIKFFQYKDSIEVVLYTGLGTTSIAFIPYGARVEFEDDKWTRMQASGNKDECFSGFTFTWDSVVMTLSLCGAWLSSRDFEEKQSGYFTIPFV